MKHEQLKALHSALLDIMREIDRVCRENNIDYFLDSGSTLGAIRHKGFIPWDDDIDVGMTRDNYDRFLSIAPQKLGNDFFLQTIDTDPHYNKLHAKVRKNNTVFMENGNENKNMHQGVFIDVFPFDRIPVSLSKIYIWLNEAYYRMFFRLTFTEYRITSFKDFLCKIIIGHNPQKRYNTLCSSFVSKKAKGMISYCYFLNEHYVFKKELFENTMDVEFEGYNFKIMKDYDEYLRIMYGDYMQLPPIEKRVTHDVFKLEL